MRERDLLVELARLPDIDALVKIHELLEQPLETPLANRYKPSITHYLNGEYDLFCQALTRELARTYGVFPYTAAALVRMVTHG